MATKTKRHARQVEDAYKEILWQIETSNADDEAYLQKLATDLYLLSKEHLPRPQLRIKMLEKVLELDVLPETGRKDPGGTRTATPTSREVHQALEEAWASLSSELKKYVDSLRDQPQERLKHAVELFAMDAPRDASRPPRYSKPQRHSKQAAKPASAKVFRPYHQPGTQQRLDLLQAVVQLDPFSTRYRLALAQAEQEAGLLDQAIAEYREVLALSPDVPHISLLLGEAMVEAGQFEEARKLFDKVAGEDLPLWKRAELGRIECALRQAKTVEDWTGVADKLERAAAAIETSLIHEKCLKAVIECNDAELREKLLGLARERALVDDGRHPVLSLIEMAARPVTDSDFEAEPPARGDHAHLNNLLQAYLLARAKPATTGGLDEQIKTLNTWRESVQRQGDQWPELRLGYLHVLDEWAQQAYKKKQYEAARALWQEAERIDPYNPAALKNTALVYTRLQDEAGYQWYWDAFTQAWSLHAEMAPEAEGYRQPLLQKHQAFANGAQKKSNTLRDPEETLALGAVWVQEAVSYLALRQLEFRNPCFRLGVLAEDWGNEAECETVLEIGCNSMHAWLALTSAWQQRYGETRLEQWRKRRLEEAKRAASQGGDARYYCYDEEIKDFLRHREQVSGHYLPLLFNVLMPAAQRLDLDDATARQRFATIGQGLLSFPHRLLRRHVIRVFEQQREMERSPQNRQAISNLIEMIEKDLEGLVENYVLGPWLGRAQEHMERQRWIAAADLLAEAQRVRPASAVVLFLLAQCGAGQDHYDEAFCLAEKARQVSHDEKMLKPIEQFVEQMDLARVSKRLDVVQKHLRQGNGAAAIQECQAALKQYPDHPYVLFVLAQAHLVEAQVIEAREVLQGAKAAPEVAADLRKAIDELSKQAEKFGPEIILSCAVPLMQAKKWKEARQRLANGLQLQPPNARVTFYDAICAAQLGEAAEAKHVALSALEQLKPDELELRKEIEGLIPQIPFIPIQEQLEKAQEAMQRKRWLQAMPTLEEAINHSPTAALPRYYLAICRFRLEHWDAAENTAREALRLCESAPEQDPIRKQLSELLKQLPLARTSKDFKAAEKAIKQKKWYEALKSIDCVAIYLPKEPVVLFYKAVCHFQLREWSSAQDTIDKALPLCWSSKHAQIETQLNQMLNAMRKAGVIS